MKKYSLVIWDFNGTIIDDLQIGIEAVNRLLSRRQLPTIDSVEAYRKVFGFPIIDYYRRVGFDFEKDSYDTLAHEWVKEYLELAENIPVRPGVTEALDSFKKAGILQIILSATESKMLKNQTDKLGITGYFDDILGTDNIYAHSKKGIAIEWMNKHKINDGVMIGDTVHDGEVADSIGVDCILVTGGHQSRETLECSGKTVADIGDVTTIVLGDGK